MWHDWQLRSPAAEFAVLPLLVVHLLGQRSDDLAVRPERLVISVWHDAQSSDCLMCGASACTKPVTDRMIVFRPAIDLIRPEDDARAVGGVGFITNFALKLSRVPSRSGAI